MVADLVTAHPRLVTLLAMVLILPLTWGSVKVLNVPDHQELVAGMFLTLVYALIVSSLVALILG